MDTARTAEEYIASLVQAPTLEALPAVVDTIARPPMNPPQWVQEKFVGSSYETAYREAERFVSRAFEHWPAEELSDYKVLDFGSGWGRILRLLLLRVGPEQVWSSDVDLSMTVLVQSTLPGVNATTNAPMPPSMFRPGMFDGVTAFSVFSHLSEDAHRAWAAEFARVLKPGGRVFMTVLEDDFLHTVEAAQAAVRSGDAPEFTRSIAAVTDDVSGDLEDARLGRFVYAGRGEEDGPRSRTFYSWAVAPRSWLEQTWGELGFTLETWVPTGDLFDQAMAVFVLNGAGGGGSQVPSTKPSLTRRARSLAGRAWRRARRTFGLSPSR